MGYRVAVLDPDPACPAAAVADRVEVGGYADAEAALRMARGCDVVTYELEHVDAALVAALLDAGITVRPGLLPLQVSQDRLAERRFVEAAGVAVAPWRALVAGDDAALTAAATELGLPLRLKAAFGGYDGRSQVRTGDADRHRRGLGTAGCSSGHRGAAGAGARLRIRAFGDLRARRPTAPVRLSRRWAIGTRMACWSSRCLPAPGRAGGGRVEPSPSPTHLAVAMDLVGLLTVELFLMPDGELVVNELAPRVHNSGHATLEACATSQFEQHIRAICGLPLGSTDVLSPAAMVNLLGDGPRRPARLSGIRDALVDPGVHLHLYDKREVFAGRKMGHLTALRRLDR